MTVGIWILGDRLTTKQLSLKNNQDNKQQTPVIFIESNNYVQQRLYHRQKLVLVWSAMRHFAEELKADNWQVTYKIASDFITPLEDWIEQYKITELQLTIPCDRPFYQLIKNLALNCQVTFLEDTHFLWDRDEFIAWAKPRKRLLMEDFYRESRKKFNVLMDGQKPVGGKWNYDKDNRKAPKKELKTPQPLTFTPDAITQEIIEYIKQENLSDYGKIEPFNWAVTRQQAQSVLAYFVEECLADFGTYQDAMLAGEYTMWHGLISPYLNLGLLEPMEVIDAIETAYYQQELPLNSVEGFIRQVMGWREYMHGIYHLQDEDYSQNNWFDHHQPLPEFFWDGSKTKMNCLGQTLTQIEETGYAHHIQRLMILSNFALIAGISPQEIENWFHSAFIDAYDWVMQTNVIGMGQFADGGILASKPYAASANYINKMSDYCQGCQYKKSDRLGEKACPFNFFYWNFLIRHQDKLRSLGRMNLVLSHLKRISPEESAQITSLASQWWEKETR
ncbi:cryptochrome/photolyase family protein [Waterburya agarophytonicola K14]|uniref:Cryptochrome/photolyase family protein n=1 Tax=Waterburya agarophytonicola KI4 TaxID=2874699 RepID=A0A964BMX2_9CYAN|nr:cryptochrome/photolyase family protein [Waterburya agarophytonicola]MCC0176328.1 cryptochrome/photolyase family protein [Waterburya agarophytonicola KI4]